MLLFVNFILYQTVHERSRSRSPVRRYDSNDDSGYEDRRANRGYRSSRYGHDVEKRDNYNQRDTRRPERRGVNSHDRNRNYRGRYEDSYNHNDRYTDDRNRSYGRERNIYSGRSRNRYEPSRNDYGPVLARELDSTYDEKVNRNYTNSVFVGNLTYYSTPEDLRSYFATIGDVVRADIITSRGHHRGMGTVEFTNTRDVDEAIRQLDGSNFMDRVIFVRQDHPPPSNGRERHSRRETSSSNKYENNMKTYVLNISNLPSSINWQALKDMFKECGPVVHADVEVDGSRNSKGFGTVIYDDIEIAHRAIEKYNGFEIEGKVLTVSLDDESEQSENTENQDDATISKGTSDLGIEETNELSLKEAATEFTKDFLAGAERNNFIFCSNLPSSTARSDLFDLFETIGKVNNAELRYDENGLPTGIAIIEYDSIEDAETCVDRLNSYNYGGCDLQISYAKHR